MTCSSWVLLLLTFANIILAPFISTSHKTLMNERNSVQLNVVTESFLDNVALELKARFHVSHIFHFVFHNLAISYLNIVNVKKNHININTFHKEIA